MRAATPDADRPTVVVGAGIAGLIVAYRLTTSGQRVAIVEAAPEPGGRIRTGHRDGLVLEAGPDGFLAGSAVLALCRELDLAAELVEPRPPAATAVLWRGRLHPLPLGTAAGVPVELRSFSTTSLFGLREKVRVLADLVLPAQRSLDPDGPLGPELRRRLGTAVVERLIEPLLGGLHGGSLDELSGGAVAPWLVDLLRRGSLVRALRRRAPTAPAMRSFRHGTDRLVAALVAALEAKAGEGGVEWFVGTAAAGLRRAEPGWEVALADGRTLAAARVVLACPAPAAATLLAAVDGALSGVLAQIPYGSSAVVNLAYRERDLVRPPEGHGFLVPRSEPHPLRGASWTSRKWPNRAPPGVLLVRAFLGGADWTTCPDGELVERAVAGLDPLLAPRRWPLLAEVHRFVDAMPRYSLGHLARLRAIEARLASLPGLVLVGSAYRGAGIAELAAAAEDAARRLTAPGPGARVATGRP